MPKRRSDDQLERAIAAIQTRPDWELLKPQLGQQPTAWNAAQDEWVKGWGGTALKSGQDRGKWWKRQNEQHRELVKAYREQRERAVTAPTAQVASCSNECSSNGSSAESAAIAHATGSAVGSKHYEGVIAAGAPARSGMAHDLPLPQSAPMPHAPLPSTAPDSSSSSGGGSGDGGGTIAAASATKQPVQQPAAVRHDVLRKELRPSSDWLKEHAASIDELHASTPRLSPGGAHVKRRIVARFNSSSDLGEGREYSENVHYTPPPNEENEQHQKQRADRHRWRECAAIERLNGAPAREAQAARQAMEAEAARAAAEAARERRKAQVVRNGWTMYDDEFRRVSESARTPQSRDAFVFYPDGTRSQVDPPRSGTRDARRLAAGGSEPALPPMQLDGVTQERLGEIRVGAQSLANWIDSADSYRWRQKKMVMARCTQHARCITYRPPGQPPSSALLGRLGMGWAGDAWGSQVLHRNIDDDAAFWSGNNNARLWMQDAYDALPALASPPLAAAGSSVVESVPAPAQLERRPPPLKAVVSASRRIQADEMSYATAEEAATCFSQLAVTSARLDLQVSVGDAVQFRNDGCLEPEVYVIMTIGEKAMVEGADCRAPLRINSTIQCFRSSLRPFDPRADKYIKHRRRSDGMLEDRAYRRVGFEQALVTMVRACEECADEWHHDARPAAPVAPASSELTTTEAAASSQPATFEHTASVPAASVPAASVPLSESGNEDPEAEWDREGSGQLQRGDARRVVQHEDDRGNLWEETIEGLPADSDEEAEMSCGLFAW